MDKAKKVIKIAENDLVDLIDNILTEAINVKKKEWLAEQANKSSKESILESKLASLEKKINALSNKK